MQLNKALLTKLADQVVALVSSGMAIEYAVAKVWKDNNIPDVMYSTAREQASKIIEDNLGWSTIKNVGTRQKAWDKLIGNDPVVREQIAKASARARLDLTKEVSNVIKSGEALRVAAVRMQAKAPGDLSSVRNDIKELAKYGASPKQIESLRRKVTSGLKGNDLKDAYRKTLNAIESGSQVAIDKQLHYAVENKVRYNMARVVNTEQSRAVFEATREEIASDPKLKFVRFVLSGSHTADECDAYANADMGYGKGVYPIDMAPVLPIHPNGRSILVAYERPKKTDAQKIDPAKALAQQAETLGVKLNNGIKLSPIVKRL